MVDRILTTAVTAVALFAVFFLFSTRAFNLGDTVAAGLATTGVLLMLVCPLLQAERHEHDT